MRSTYRMTTKVVQSDHITNGCSTIVHRQGACNPKCSDGILCRAKVCTVRSIQQNLPPPNDTIATPQPKEVDVAYVASVTHGYDHLLQNSTTVRQLKVNRDTIHIGLANRSTTLAVIISTGCSKYFIAPSLPRSCKSTDFQINSCPRGHSVTNHVEIYTLK